MKLLILVVSMAVFAVTAESYQTRSDGQNDQCPQFWVLFEGACYRYFGDRVPWQTARSRCRDIYTHEGRADLVSIHSDEENDFAYDLFRNNAGDTPNISLNTGKYYGAWIGLYQTTAGSTGPFVWSDGSSNTDYESWMPGEPNNAAKAEDCVHFWRRGPHDDQLQSWNDVGCHKAYPYICKVKPNY